jgi:hypothetical protein
MDVIFRTIGWKCWCKRTTRVFKDEEGYYLRCLECGRRIAYDWTALGSFDRRHKGSHHSVPACLSFPASLPSQQPSPGLSSPPASTLDIWRN